MGENNIKLFLDEDFILKEFKKLQNEKKIKYKKIGLAICLCASNLMKRRIISKITNRRIHLILDIFNDRCNIMKPSKLKELLGIKNINIKFFKNAMFKFYKIIEDNNEKRVFLNYLYKLRNLGPVKSL